MEGIGRATPTGSASEKPGTFKTWPSWITSLADTQALKRALQLLRMIPIQGPSLIELNTLRKTHSQPQYSNSQYPPPKASHDNYQTQPTGSLLDKQTVCFLESCSHSPLKHDFQLNPSDPYRGICFPTGHFVLCHPHLRQDYATLPVGEHRRQLQ